MPPSPLTRLRRICLALPEAHEVKAWGEPTFRVRNKLFAMYASASNHHGAGRGAVWCKAAPGNQSIMVQANPELFFVPPYVGPSGWIGVWLDRADSWKELPAIIEDAYRLVAPKRLLVQLNGHAFASRPRMSPNKAPIRSAAGVKTKGRSVTKRKV
jgi:hypothetical protein